MSLSNQNKKRSRPSYKDENAVVSAVPPLFANLAQLLALLSQGKRLCLHNCSEVGSAMGAGDVTFSKV